LPPRGSAAQATPTDEVHVTDAPLKAIAPERVAEELRRICRQRDAGELNRDEYEHRFARMISELRDRKIAGTRAEIMAALLPLKTDGTVDGVAWDRLVKSLGLG
jgi:hypothetical protein